MDRYFNWKIPNSLWEEINDKNFEICKLVFQMHQNKGHYDYHLPQKRNSPVLFFNPSLVILMFVDKLLVQDSVKLNPLIGDSIDMDVVFDYYISSFSEGEKYFSENLKPPIDTIYSKNITVWLNDTKALFLEGALKLIELKNMNGLSFVMKDFRIKYLNHRIIYDYAYHSGILNELIHFLNTYKSLKSKFLNIIPKEYWLIFTSNIAEVNSCEDNIDQINLNKPSSKTPGRKKSERKSLNDIMINERFCHVTQKIKFIAAIKNLLKECTPQDFTYYIYALQELGYLMTVKRVVLYEAFEGLLDKKMGTNQAKNATYHNIVSLVKMGKSPKYLEDKKTIIRNMIVEWDIKIKSV